MDANQVNSVINNICEKIGVSINNLQDFVPMFVKYEITYCLCWIVVGIVFFVVGFIIYKKALVAHKEVSIWDKDGPFFCILLGIIVMIISFRVVSSCTFDIIEWCVNPEAKTIVYILKIISTN